MQPDTLFDIPGEDLPSTLADLDLAGFDGLVSIQSNGLYTVAAQRKAESAGATGACRPRSPLLLPLLLPHKALPSRRPS